MGKVTGKVTRKFVTREGEVVEHPTAEQMEAFYERLAYLVCGFLVWQEKEKIKRNQHGKDQPDFLSVMVS
ncbi:MAG: hypothetical protein PWQ18_687 [Clostridia bacterium]|nr:hypothetical protein [Clostridia bacterium]